MLKSFRRRKISKKRRRKLFLYWFIALILIIAFFANFVKVFSAAISRFTEKPQGSKLAFEKFEGEKITGLIISNPLILATFDPLSQKVDLLELPQNLYLDLGEKGFFLASKVDKLDADNEGIKLQAAAVSSNLRVPVDFYLDFGPQMLDGNKIAEWRKRILEPSSVFWFAQIPTKSPKVLATNFTLLDQFKLFWKLRKVRGDKFNYQKMDLNNFEELILPNGDKVLKVASDGLAPDTAAVFQDLKLAAEGLTIEVINASGRVGAGEKISQICQNIGIAASASQSATQVLPKTQILAKKELKNSLTVKRLVKTFAGDIGQLSDNSFSDVEIVIGSNIAQQLQL